MKRFFVLLMALCLLCTSAALADAAQGRLNQRISTRTGPGTQYTEPGSFLSAGHDVKVHTKLWDDRNEIWWVQVEFTSGRNTYRVYTGSWRMDVDLTRVPEEQPLETCYLTRTATVYAGPGTDYVRWKDRVQRDTSATLMEVENGYGLIECWNSARNQLWRVWADLDDLSCGYAYGDQEDTYPDEGWYENWYDPYAAIGQWCTITGGSVNCRVGPGTEYPIHSYVNRGERFMVLDCDYASNGLAWYQIRTAGRYLWISSGLASLDGYWVEDNPSGAFPIGEMCCIISESGNARSGPGQEYDRLAYVYEDEYYLILDTGAASNGRTWYQIRVDGILCWISGGIATVNGVIY